MIGGRRATPGGTPGAGDGALPSRVAATLDELIARHAEPAAEVAAARQAYEQRRGQVHDDHPHWERWSAAFVEWFVIERLAPGATRPAAAASLGRPDADAHVIRALCTSMRSLFEVVRLDRGHAELLDVLGGGEYLVDEPRALIGVTPGDVAELRLVGIEGRVVFARTFIFHPALARDAIVDHARALLARGAPRRDVIDAIARSRLALDRVVDPRLAISAHRQAAARRVYEYRPSEPAARPPVKVPLKPRR